MVEIELKAHVQDVVSLATQLEQNAQFQRCCYKSDTYWKESQKQIQIRIREEQTLFTEPHFFQAEQWPFERAAIQSADKEEILVTYKQKELREAAFEVNQEHEFHVDKREPLETFLQDAGFVVSIKKEKLVAAWQWDEVLLELCSIPELGHFLELEILCDSDSPPVVAGAHKTLRKVLAACGIQEDAIERRYYSELLQEVRGQQQV